MSMNRLGIYIHWPYCISKCPYCDFNSHKIKDYDQNEWLIAYKNQIKYFKEYLIFHNFENIKLTSIFFGGGTPSLMNPKLVEQISELIVEINTQGVTVLLVEQNANMALKISTHGYIMETGNIVMDNSSEKLMKDKDVQEFYLGLNTEGTERKSFKDVKHYKRKKRWLS